MKATKLLPSTPSTSWMNYAGSAASQGNTGVILQSGTWIPPVPGTYEIICIGGGGGGKCFYGAGGGSGFLNSSTLSLSGAVSVTIGAKGLRGTGSGGTASSGGQTIFGASLVTANGGGGGAWAGSGGAGGSGGGATCDRSNARGAWGGGGGGFDGSNGGEAQYKQTSSTGGHLPGGAGSQSVPLGKGTNKLIPPGGSGVGIYNYLAGFGAGRLPLNSVMDYPYEGIYGYGKGYGGGFVFGSYSTAAGSGGGGSGWSNDCGDGTAGMIVWRLITPLPFDSRIGAPQNISVSDTGTARSFNDAQLTVSWTAPSNTSGSAITQYRVTSNSGIDTTTTSTSATFTGIGSNTSHIFTIVAYTAVAYGETGTSSQIVATTVPQAPTIGTPTINSSTSVAVPFTQPLNNGGKTITSYTVTASPAGFTGTGTTSPINVDGSYPGNVLQTYTITATNANGTSTASLVSPGVYPAGRVPDAPQLVNAVVNSTTSVEASFLPPANNGGLAITSYTATATPSGFSATGSGSPLTINGAFAANTLQTIAVYATNSAGNSPNSNTLSVAPNGVPNPTRTNFPTGSFQSFGYNLPAANATYNDFTYTFPTNTPTGFYYLVAWVDYNPNTTNPTVSTAYRTRRVFSLHVVNTYNFANRIPVTQNLATVTGNSDFLRLRAVRVTNTTRSQLMVDTGESLTVDIQYHTAAQTIQVVPGDTITISALLQGPYNTCWFNWTHNAL